MTAHFGDTGWVELLVARVRAIFPELPDENVFVIDQDRTDSSSELLRERLGAVTILRYPRSEEHFRYVGHDHAHVLNLAVREIDADFTMVFDSDAHPVDPTLRPKLAQLLAGNDAVMAAPSVGDLSHAAFMVLGPAVDRSRLLFDEGQLHEREMTGARVFAQVTSAGQKVELLRSTRAFGGRWGGFLLDGGVYHHGSGSFEFADDARLRAKARYWRRESEFFRRRVFAGRYDLTRAEAVAAAALALRRRAPEGAAELAHRLLGPRLRARLKPLLRP